jgi:hypothetical protein
VKFYVTIRQSVRGTIVAALIYLAVLTSQQAGAAPVVFWVSEPVSPGDVVMAYGGDLQGVRSVEISRLSDLTPGDAPKTAASNTAIRAKVPVLQASDHSFKFMLPNSFAPGVFALGYGAYTPRLIDAPQVDWCQAAGLLPGLRQNEAAPGSSIQIIGRNFVPAGHPGKVRVVLRGSTRRNFDTQVTQIDKYSIVAALPSSLPPGTYQIWVHNGYGGPAAWSGGLMLTVKRAAVWPASLFNVKSFGAAGDNMLDDSAALRKAFDTAKRNGGGIIYFPAGTYRLNGWFEIPHRVVLRGEDRDLVWLKWPLTEPASTADIIPSVLYASGEFGIESLSFMVRNAQTIVRDLSWDAAASGRAPLPELQSEIPAAGSEHDIFIRHVDFQLLYNSGRPLHPERSAQWKLNGFGWANNELVKVVAIDGVRNVEVSNCRFVGGTQRILDSVNARLVRNNFSNQWATLAWTDLGGEYIVFENNDITGASSWRGNRLPVRHLYCAFNHSTNLVAGEREALTFDVNRIVPRRSAQRGGAAQAVAWQGRALSATPNGVQLQSANLPPHAYRGLDLLVLDGRGAGQSRTITDNSAHGFNVTPAWDVALDASSVVLAYQLYGDCILYRNRAEDTSVFLQIWGFLCDMTYDGNEVERSQGMWGLSGWFVQWLNNRLKVAVTFHPGVGPGGDSREEMTPEQGAPYGLMGFAIAGMSQLSLPFPYVRGCVIRANHLSYGHRVVLRFGYGRHIIWSSSPAIDDVIINRNSIDHDTFAIDVDANATAVLIAANKFTHVNQPMRLLAPQRCLVLQ